MKVDATIDLSADEVCDLARVLKCKDKDVAARLAGYARAALAEYVAMLLGQKVFTRGSDIREYRLFLLIQNVFGNRIPDDADVCRLFQCTPSESRGLIRSVAAKYQSQVHAAIEDSIRKVLQRAKKNDDVYLVTINNATIVEAMNAALSDINGELPPISRFRNTVSTYEIAQSSYDQLMKLYRQP